MYAPGAPFHYYYYGHCVLGILKELQCTTEHDIVLAGEWRWRVRLQWNPGFGKTLGQVDFCWRGLYMLHILLLAVSSCELFISPPTHSFCFWQRTF